MAQSDDYYAQAAAGLEAAAKALRACGEEEAEEIDSDASTESSEAKPKNIREAGMARRAQLRKQKASGDYAGQ